MIWLIFAHFIGDFALQKEWISLNKGRYWYLLLAHSLIWTACICVALQYIGKYHISDVPILLIGHLICDRWKCRATKDFPTWHFYVDQTWHLLQCLIVWRI